MATKIRPFNLHADTETRIQTLAQTSIDSDYIQARQQSFDDEAQQDYGLITGAVTITKDFGSIA
tara:strand:- start:504 stop:695 length:192 start_codon:yes stop_codon:yes gene_type:complete